MGWGMERIAMSQTERNWLAWLKRARDGLWTQEQAATKMKVSERWVRKLLARMKEEGDRAVVQFASADWHDLWIVELDLPSGRTRVLTHDRDDAWLGGPPPLSNYGGPTLLEWLPGGQLVFA